MQKVSLVLGCGGILLTCTAAIAGAQPTKRPTVGPEPYVPLYARRRFEPAPHPQPSVNFVWRGKWESFSLCQDLDYLQPGLHDKVLKYLNLLGKDGIRVQVFETGRSLKRQRYYLEKGVSKTLQSKHLTGHAVDIVPINKQGHPYWPLVNDNRWRQIALRAEKCGLDWAYGGAGLAWGDFPRPFHDLVHFEELGG